MDGGTGPGHTVEKIRVEGQEIRCQGTKFLYRFLPETGYQNALYDEMICEYYQNQGRIPEKFKDSNRIISRIEFQVQQGDMPRSMEDLQLKFSDRRLELPVQTTFAAEFGEYEAGRKLEYVDPDTNQVQYFYVNALISQDVYEGVTDENVRLRLQDVCPPDKKLLTLLYENPCPGTSLHFFLKSELDKPTIHRSASNASAGAFGIFGNWPSKNGGRTLAETLGQVGEAPEGPVEIELFSITRTIPMEAYYEPVQEK